jgi:hypothetical protein
VVFVLDRSVDDPYSGNLHNACARLQRNMNETLETIAKKGGGAVEVAIVTYGVDSAGEADVRTALEGGHTGRTLVRDHEIVDGALRFDEFEEDLPDGVGGIIKRPRKLPVLVEIEPTSASPIAAGFAAAADVVATWLRENPASHLPPIVLHLTRGRHEPEDIAAAAQAFLSLSNRHGAAPLLYHQVVTELPHPSVVYPLDESELTDDSLQALYHAASPVLGCEQLAEQIRSLQPGARGLVVNGKMDLAWRTIEKAKA